MYTVSNDNWEGRVEAYLKILSNHIWGGGDNWETISEDNRSRTRDFKIWRRDVKDRTVTFSAEQCPDASREKCNGRGWSVSDLAWLGYVQNEWSDRTYCRTHQLQAPGTTSQLHRQTHGLFLRISHSYKHSPYFWKSCTSFRVTVTTNAHCVHLLWWTPERFAKRPTIRNTDNVGKDRSHWSAHRAVSWNQP